MLLDVTLENVTELAPTVVLLFDSSTELELLLTTTLIGTSGAVCRLTLMLPCMNWPIVVLLTVVVGWVTVAVIDWYCEGVLKVSCGPKPELIVGGPEMAIVVGPPTTHRLEAGRVGGVASVEYHRAGDGADPRQGTGHGNADWPDAWIQLAGTRICEGAGIQDHRLQRDIRGT